MTGSKAEAEDGSSPTSGVQPALGMCMKTVAILVAMVIPGSVFATCEAPTDHVEERRCEERMVDQVSQEIRAEQQHVRAKITTWDAAPNDKARTLALFNKAASEFQNYQTRQCEFEASMAAGGNGASDMRFACQIRLGRAYLKSLKEQAASFEVWQGSH